MREFITETFMITLSCAATLAAGASVIERQVSMREVSIKRGEYKDGERRALGHAGARG
jgi:hypothetical protein